MHRCLVWAVLVICLAAPATAMDRSAPDLAAQARALASSEAGLELGIQVWRAGSGLLYSQNARQPMAAASAIKTVIALDLMAIHGDGLDSKPVGTDVLLSYGGHAAFRGFAPDQLERARRDLRGKTYRELTRIMMGRTDQNNDVYNAACNLVLIKLGGPEAVTRRVRAMDPAFSGFHLTRYMRQWDDHDDNRATPESLVALYRMLAAGQVPGLSPERVETLREMLLDQGTGGEGSVFEKAGTLFPQPMVRVHAGYMPSAGGDLVYAVMGEIPASTDTDPASQFVRLLNGIDALTESCRRLARP